jgi:hypothetical protein
MGLERVGQDSKGQMIPHTPRNTNPINHPRNYNIFFITQSSNSWHTKNRWPQSPKMHSLAPQLISFQSLLILNRQEADLVACD